MVLVCVTDQASCARLIKAGRSLADILSVPLKVISVRPRRSDGWLASEELEYLFTLSKQLDAEMIIRFHDYAAEAVADYIEKSDIRAIIVGEPPQPGQSVFITSLESRFANLPVICVKDDGQMCLAAVYSGSEHLDDFR